MFTFWSQRTRVCLVRAHGFCTALAHHSIHSNSPITCPFARSIVPSPSINASPSATPCLATSPSLTCQYPVSLPSSRRQHDVRSRASESCHRRITDALLPFVLPRSPPLLGNNTTALCTTPTHLSPSRSLPFAPTHAVTHSYPPARGAPTCSHLCRGDDATRVISTVYIVPSDPHPFVPMRTLQVAHLGHSCRYTGSACYPAHIPSAASQLEQVSVLPPDGTPPTAERLVADILDDCPVTTIHAFF